MNHSLKENKTIICLIGQTAIGKTNLAIELSKHLPIKIISVDSSQVYRGMDIGTSKPSKDELLLAPHELIDICDIFDCYSVGRFREDAIKSIEKIICCSKSDDSYTPVLVGGTMMYFKSLQSGLSCLPQRNDQIRQRLDEEILKNGIKSLHVRLKKIDPISSGRINENDSQRLQRALELYELTGKTPTELYNESKTEALPYNIVNIALFEQDKDILKNRIKNRFDAMIKNGFLEEVEDLCKKLMIYHGKNINEIKSGREACITAVGYKQVYQYMISELTYDEMRDKAIVATCQLAKRQMTWLRSFTNLNWFDNRSETLVDDVVNFLSLRI